MTDRVRMLVVAGITAGMTVGLAVLASAAPSRAQGAASHLVVVGQDGGRAQALVLDGQTGYWGIGPRLVIVDVARPAQPTLLGRTPPLGGLVEDVVLDGDHAFIMVGPAGLRVVDVTDPATPRVVAAIDTPGHGVGAAVIGTQLFVADGDAGVTVIDITEPTAPQLMAVVPAPTGAYDVLAAGSFVYYLDMSVAVAGTVPFGLGVIDARDPTALRGLGVRSDLAAWHMARAGERLLLATDDALVIVDLTDPARPSQIGALSDAALAIGGPTGLTASADRAYVVSAFSERPGAAEVDLTDPTAPRATGNVWLAARGSTPTAIVADSRAVFVADRTGVRTLDPTLRQIGGLRDAGQPVALDVRAGRAYLAGRTAGLAVLDVSDPTQPALLGAREGGRFALGAVAAPIDAPEDIVYATSSTDQDDRVFLHAFDVTDPALPVEPARVQVADGGVGSVVGRGRYAFVAHAGGVTAYDVISPTTPVVTGTLGLERAVNGLARTGDHLAVTDDQGLQLIDAANPAALAVRGQMGTAGAARAVAAANGRAYVLHPQSLTIVDVADPDDPIALGTLEISAEVGQPISVAVAGDRAFVGLISDLEWVMLGILGDGGPVGAVLTIDVSDPTAPRVIDTAPLPWPPRGLRVTGGHVYAATELGGLWMLAVDAGVRPTPTATATPPVLPTVPPGPTSVPAQPSIFLPALYADR